MPAPPVEIRNEILYSTTQILRRMDIYEADGTTPWMLNAPFTDGKVSVSISRSERRTLDCTLYNGEGELNNYPGGFWYDKIIKPYRGFRYGDQLQYEWWGEQGEFLIDNISGDNFPRLVTVTARDYTKKLLVSKFTHATLFPAGDSVESVIKTIATNGGITKFNLESTGKTLGKDFLFDRGTERWAAITDIANAFALEVFFDATGTLNLRWAKDPTTSPVTYDFDTGYRSRGNVATYRKSSSDTRLYNHIIVTGESSDAVPVWAEAINTEPTSPTRVDAIGDRVYQYTSSFITTQAQAQDVADSFLKVHALEQFEINLGAIVVPWLEGGEIVKFWDPNPVPDAPDRFLLTDFAIPLKLGTMDVTGKRVSIVGGS